jgi:disulfide bond formation protein DsbB
LSLDLSLRRHATLGFAAAVVLPLLAVAAALHSQYRMDMQPCPWCVLQRLIFVAVSVAALPGLLLRLPMVRRACAALFGVLALCGVAAALWQHFVAASSTSCKQTLADQIMQGVGASEALPEVFAAYASCADAAVKLLGLPYEFYSLGLFSLLAALAVLLLRPPKQRR